MPLLLGVFPVIENAETGIRFVRLALTTGNQAHTW